MANKIKTLKVNKLTDTVQRRLEAFGFKIVWIKIETGYALIGYK